jgi:DNA-3-methyladenine glycosylase II
MNKRAIAHLRNDPVMAKIVERIGPVKLKPRRLPPYESLVSAIIHQQLSGHAAAAILARFKSAFGADGFPHAELVAKADVEMLRGAGLSRAKAAYIKDIAGKSLAGEIPRLEECDDLSDAELVARLTTIKGVGRWTVEMLLIFNLGKPDVLPVHDLGVRRGFQLAYGKRKLPEPEKLEEFGKRWGPFRTTASLLLWRIADALKNGEW